MTIYDRVQQLVNGDRKVDMETDSLDKLICMAYWIGREEATRATSDAYAAHMAAQTERAKTCRYHRMALDILQNGKGYIYMSDYRKDMTASFGSDETEF